MPRYRRGRIGDSSDGQAITMSSPSYLRSTLSQLTVMVVAVSALYLLHGAASALSLLCGMACALLPQWWFALRMQRATAAGAARAARLGMAAEAGKFLLATLSFAIVFAAVRPDYPLLVFLGFIGLWLVQVIEGVRLLRRPRGSAERNT